MDLEQANRILELKPGATFRQVSEAREDLLALWNPDRLSDHPRLRAKAARKMGEINQAYEVLMEHLGQGDAPGNRGFDPVPEPKPSATSIADSRQAAPARGDHRASLYEEVFSRRKEEEGRQIPVWPIAGGILLLVLGIFFYQSWSSEEVASDPEAGTTEELASEPNVTVPGGEPVSASKDPAEEMPDTAAAEAEAVPSEAPQDKPPAERVVAAPPKTKPPPPARAATSPPPARRPARPQADQPPANAQRPALRRESAASESTGEETRREEEEEERAEQFEQVFRDLLANSTAARKLVDEEFADLLFARWKVVDQTDSEIWIELVAQKPDGDSVHFTWAINPADGTTRALSAAARGLERSGQAN